MQSRLTRYANVHHTLREAIGCQLLARQRRRRLNQSAACTTAASDRRNCKRVLKSQHMRRKPTPKNYSHLSRWQTGEVRRTGPSEEFAIRNRESAIARATNFAPPKKRKKFQCGKNRGPIRNPPVTRMHRRRRATRPSGICPRRRARHRPR